MSSLLLGDLNDYIQPSVNCVKPSAEGQGEREKEQQSVKGGPVLTNLNDCLACSGCITSAEAVLVTEQTRQQLYAVLADNAQLPTASQKIVVVSICPSSRTALCKFYGEPSPVSVFCRLYHFFTSTLGAHMLVDATFGYNFALKAAAEEFVQRYQSGQETSQKMQTLLSSECPGWVCYAEKKQQAMLEQICTVRSSQQIMGVLIKSYLAEILSLKMERQLGRNDIFHVSIQACYDKKLEAARGEFSDSEHVRDVDCVIATNELVQMISERCPEGGFLALPESQLPDDLPLSTWYRDAMGQIHLQRHFGSSAGGYLSYILRYAAKTIFDIELAEDLLQDPRITSEYHRGNIDYAEFSLRASAKDPKDSPVLLNFAAIYGFRNIQTFVQKARARRVDYHFVEVMACPGACLFGGGQPPLRAEAGTTANGPAQNNKTVQEIYRREVEKIWETLDIWPPSHPFRQQIDRVWDWIASTPDNPRLLYTTYHPLEKDLGRKNPLISVKW